MRSASWAKPESSLVHRQTWIIDLQASMNFNISRQLSPMKCLTVDKQSLHACDSKCKQEECTKFQITHCIPGQLCSINTFFVTPRKILIIWQKCLYPHTIFVLVNKNLLKRMSSVLSPQGLTVTICEGGQQYFSSLQIISLIVSLNFSERQDLQIMSHGSKTHR